MSKEKIGVGYNKPFNVFPLIQEIPVDDKLIYCDTKAQAQLILRQRYREALDAIEKEYYATHLAIERIKGGAEDE